MDNPLERNEVRRLATLRGYEVLDSVPEPTFDDIVELASRICETPMSLVTLVDEQRQWFKARKGVAIAETERSASFCAIAMHEPGIFEVLDASTDARFSANRLVTDAPGLRFYAGAPLVAPNGAPLGMLCVLDSRPREPLSESQKFALRVLAQQVMAQLELRRAVRTLAADSHSLEATNIRLQGRVHEQHARLEASERVLQQSQKLESLGQLTGGIAHDFNNLLQAIVTSVGASQKLIAAGRAAEAERFLNMAITSARRGAAMTQRLLTFARQQPSEAVTVDVNQLLGSIEELLRRACGEAIAFRLTRAPRPVHVRCDPNRLENAVLNLVINSRDAMPEGGSATVAVAVVDLQAGDALLQQQSVSAGRYVCVAVRDSGTGMTAEVVLQAFEPFFTTKPAGKGTGLGLSTINSFVREYDGFANIDSRPGAGTTVSLYLPLMSADSQTVAHEARPATPPEVRGSESILILEDDATVRELMVEMLQDMGYTVLAAADGSAGLTLLRANSKIDLLITDVGLPRLSGPEVVQAARRLAPGIRVLYITGYATPSSADLIQGDSRATVLAKPFVMTEFSAAVRQLLEP